MSCRGRARAGVLVENTTVMSHVSKAWTTQQGRPQNLRFLSYFGGRPVGVELVRIG